MPNKDSIGRGSTESTADQAVNVCHNNAISVNHDPVHSYKMYKEKQPPSILELDSSFYLSVNYFRTDTHASVEGKNWFKAQTMRVTRQTKPQC